MLYLNTPPLAARRAPGATLTVSAAVAMATMLASIIIVAFTSVIITTLILSRCGSMIRQEPRPSTEKSR